MTRASATVGVGPSGVEGESGSLRLSPAISMCRESVGVAVPDFAAFPALPDRRDFLDGEAARDDAADADGEGFVDALCDRSF